MGGDLIVGVEGTSLRTTDKLRDVLSGHKPGDKITLQMYRGAKKLTVTVTLGRQPSVLPTP